MQGTILGSPIFGNSQLGKVFEGHFQGLAKSIGNYEGPYIRVRLAVRDHKALTPWILTAILATYYYSS